MASYDALKRIEHGLRDIERCVDDSASDDVMDRIEHGLSDIMHLHTMLRGGFADDSEVLGRMEHGLRDMYALLRSSLSADETGVVGCTVERQPYTGGWKSSMYLREPLLPVSVAGECLGAETLEALKVRDALVGRDQTLVNFMRDALRTGVCANCLQEIMFEVDHNCRVVVSVAKQLLKVACSPECYEQIAADTASHPCLVFWYQTPKTAASSPNTTPPQPCAPRAVAAPPRFRQSPPSEAPRATRRRLFPAPPVA
jgi:hypothetical protein